MRPSPAQSEAWLVPALYDKISLKDFSRRRSFRCSGWGCCRWDLRARLEREPPTHFEAPTGTMLAIDYEAEQGPTIAVRLQELFGLNTHPSIAGGAVPLVLELLSPAQRPVQVTRDIPVSGAAAMPLSVPTCAAATPATPGRRIPPAPCRPGGLSPAGRDRAKRVGAVSTVHGVVFAILSLCNIRLSVYRCNLFDRSQAWPFYFAWGCFRDF